MMSNAENDKLVRFHLTQSAVWRKRFAASGYHRDGEEAAYHARRAAFLTAEVSA